MLEIIGAGLVLFLLYKTWPYLVLGFCYLIGALVMAAPFALGALTVFLFVTGQPVIALTAFMFAFVLFIWAYFPNLLNERY